MRYGPPRALLNVIPPLAQNHLHYSSEVWISLSLSLLKKKPPEHIWCFNKPLRSPSSLHLLRRFHISRAGFSVSAATLSTTLQGSRVGPCLIYRTLRRRSRMLFMIQSLSFTLNAAVLRCDIICVCFSQHVTFNMHESATAGGLKSSNYIRRGLRLADWIFFFSHNYHDTV